MPCGEHISGDSEAPIFCPSAGRHGRGLFSPQLLQLGGAD